MPGTPALLARVERALAEATLAPDDTIVVGFSGGVDSLSLLMLLSELSSAHQGPRPHAVIVDHGLRPESGEEARRALALAAGARSPGTIVRVDLTPWMAGGLEAAARRARYAALATAAEGLGALWIALGHTRDDQAETVLLHLLRGTGTSGLRAMQPVSFHDIPTAPRETGRPFGILRPLLGVRRCELAALVAASGLAPIEDPSNHDPRFRRNRVRHELLPLAEQIAPGATEAIARSAEVIGIDADYLDASVRDAWLDAGTRADGLVRIARDAARQLAPAVRRRLLRAAIMEVASGQGGPSRERIEALEAALLRGERATLELGGDRVARVDAAGVLLGPAARITEHLRASCGLPLFLRGRNEARGGISIALTGDLRLLLAQGWELRVTAPAGWTLRSRLPGDRLLAPDGSRRRLQDWLVNRKVPAEVRDGLPLLVHGGVVRWVAGLSGATFSDPQAGARARVDRSAGASGEGRTSGE